MFSTIMTVRRVLFCFARENGISTRSHENKSKLSQAGLSRMIRYPILRIATLKAVHVSIVVSCTCTVIRKWLA